MKKIYGKFTALLTACCVAALMTGCGKTETTSDTSDAATSKSDSSKTEETTEALSSNACGIDGDNLTWELKDGTLTIRGEGDMADWGNWIEGKNPAPWIPEIANITKLVIEDGVTSIGDYAFRGLRKVKSIEIADSVTSVGEYGLSGFASVVDMPIPKNLKYIEKYAYAFNYFETITLPEGVERIDEGAFHYCPELVQINIPKTVTEIGDHAFLCTEFDGGHGKLRRIIVDSENPNYYCVDDALIDRRDQTLLYYPPTIAGSFTVPDGIKKIAPNAFSACDALTHIILPESVDVIGEYAFEYCKNLQSITMPQSMTSIEEHAFYNCRLLQSIRIPDGITAIERMTFYDCHKLTEVVFPESLEEIKECAFAECKVLQNVVLPNQLRRIEDGAFSTCKAMNRVVIPESVEEYDLGAFNGYYCLHDITVMNPDCRLFGSHSAHVQNFVYRGYENSTIAEFCRQRNLNFIPLEGSAPTETETAPSEGETTDPTASDTEASAEMTESTDPTASDTEASAEMTESTDAGSLQ